MDPVSRLKETGPSLAGYPAGQSPSMQRDGRRVAAGPRAPTGELSVTGELPDGRSLCLGLTLSYCTIIVTHMALWVHCQHHHHPRPPCGARPSAAPWTRTNLKQVLVNALQAYLRTPKKEPR
jgi:hypothetical protein